MGLKILLVHNNKMRWADVFRAEELKRWWEAMYVRGDEVMITNRWNLPDGDNYDVIHFLYSGTLTKTKKYILEHKDKVFTSLVSQRSLDGMWDDKKGLLEIFKKTRCCVCQNIGLLEQLPLTAEAVYIPNGVDTELFKRDFVAGYVGAKDSSKHKGLHLAQEACDDLGIELKIVHENTYEHEEMPNFYKEIDVLLIPSESEGCHNPTLEALSMNVPVISTCVGIAKELDGVRIVGRDVNSIKKALLKMMPREKLLEKYTWNNIAEQYRELYVEKLGIK